MRNFLNTNYKIPSILISLILVLSLSSCATTQDGYYDSDGIYRTESRASNNDVVVIKDHQASNTYRNYFDTEARKYDFEDEDIITNVDDYEGYQETDTVYVEEGYSNGAPPWDYSDSNVSVSFNFGFGVGFGYGGWGYPGYGWGYPGYGWGYPGYGWGYPGYGWGYPGYPGYRPPYYPGYRPPYYGYSYGKRDTYNTRPWSRNSDRYQRVSSTGKRGGVSNNIYRDATKNISDRSNYSRNTNRSTRNYNRSNSSSKNNSYNRSNSSNTIRNRSNSRPSTPSYNPGRSSGSGSMRSSGSSRGRRQASVDQRIIKDSRRTYASNNSSSSRNKVVRTGNVNYSPNKVVRSGNSSRSNVKVIRSTVDKNGKRTVYVRRPSSSGNSYTSRYANQKFAVRSTGNSSSSRSGSYVRNTSSRTKKAESTPTKSSYKSKSYNSRSRSSSSGSSYRSSSRSSYSPSSRSSYSGSSRSSGYSGGGSSRGGGRSGR